MFEDLEDAAVGEMALSHPYPGTDKVCPEHTAKEIAILPHSNAWQLSSSVGLAKSLTLSARVFIKAEN